MKDSLVITISAFAVLALVALADQVASYPAPDGHSGAVIPHKAGEIGLPEDRSRAILYLMSLLGRPVGNNAPRAKKTCLLNAGLSHSCDYRDAVGAIEDGYYLANMDTPGRK